LDEAAWGGLTPQRELDLLQRAIRLDPNSARIMAGIADRLNALCRHDEALSRIERAIEIGQSSPDAILADYRLGKTETLVYLRRYHEAKNLFLEIVEARPSLAFSFDLLAEHARNHRRHVSAGTRPADPSSEDARFWDVPSWRTDIGQFAEKYAHVTIGMTPTEVSELVGYPNISFTNSKGVLYWRYYPAQAAAVNFGPWIGIVNGPTTAFVVSFTDGRVHDKRRIE